MTNARLWDPEALRIAARERIRAHEYWQLADIDGDGVVGPQDAVAFFSQSGLPKKTLSSLWQAARDSNGVVKDIAGLQNALLLVADALEHSPSVNEAQAQAVSALAASLTLAQRSKYNSHFSKLLTKLTGSPPEPNAKVSAREAATYFARAGLAADSLQRVLTSVDAAGTGRLDEASFAAAMHLVYAFLEAKRKGSPPPPLPGSDARAAHLPAPAAKSGGAPPPPPAVPSAASFTPTSSVDVFDQCSVPNTPRDAEEGGEGRGPSAAAIVAALKSAKKSNLGPRDNAVAPAAASSSQLHPASESTPGAPPTPAPDVASRAPPTRALDFGTAFAPAPLTPARAPHDSAPESAPLHASSSMCSSDGGLDWAFHDTMESFDAFAPAPAAASPLAGPPASEASHTPGPTGSGVEGAEFFASAPAEADIFATPTGSRTMDALTVPEASSPKSTLKFETTAAPPGFGSPQGGWGALFGANRDAEAPAVETHSNVLFNPSYENKNEEEAALAELAVKKKAAEEEVRAAQEAREEARESKRRWQLQRDELQAEVEELETRARKLRDESRPMEEEAASAAAEVAALQTQVEQVRATTAQLEADVAAAREQTRERAAQLEADAAAAREEARRLRAQRESWQEEAARETTALEQARATLLELREEEATRKAECSEAEGVARRLGEARASARAEIMEVSELIQQEEARAAELQETTSAELERTEATKAALLAQKDHLASCQAETRVWEARVQEERRLVATLQGQVDVLSKQARHQESTTQSYQRQLGELEDEAARLEMLQTTNTAHKLAERTNTDLEPRNDAAQSLGSAETSSANHKAPSDHQEAPSAHQEAPSTNQKTSSANHKASSANQDAPSANGHSLHGPSKLSTCTTSWEAPPSAPETAGKPSWCSFDDSSSYAPPAPPQPKANSFLPNHSTAEVEAEQEASNDRQRRFRANGLGKEGEEQGAVGEPGGYAHSERDDAIVFDFTPRGHPNHQNFSSADHGVQSRKDTEEGFSREQHVGAGYGVDPAPSRGTGSPAPTETSPSASWTMFDSEDAQTRRDLIPSPFEEWLPSDAAAPTSAVVQVNGLSSVREAAGEARGEGGAHSVSQRDGACGLPTGWGPMSAEERELCEGVFAQLTLAGSGGVTKEQGQSVCARMLAGRAEPADQQTGFATLWRLSDINNKNLLDLREFSLFVALNRAVAAGEAHLVPVHQPSLTPLQAAFILSEPAAQSTLDKDPLHPFCAAVVLDETASSQDSQNSQAWAEARDFTRRSMENLAKLQQVGRKNPQGQEEVQAERAREGGANWAVEDAWRGGDVATEEEQAASGLASPREKHQLSPNECEEHKPHQDQKRYDHVNGQDQVHGGVVPGEEADVAPESARPESTLAKLTSMGFSPAACRDAVAVHPDHDLDKCVAWLLAAERSASVYDSDQASLSSSLGSSVRGSALAASPELARQGSALAGASGAKWSVSVQRLLMRDPRVMVNAHLAVSVMDSQGRVVHPVQTTGEALQRDAAELKFDAIVYMHTPLEELPPEATLIFELRHLKARAKKVSVRCWAYLKIKDIQTGVQDLPLYMKPVDPKLKRVKRFDPKQQSNELLFTIEQCEDV